MKNSLLLFIILCSLSVKAQNTFTVKQAVDYALLHEAKVQNARLEEEVSRQNVREIVGLGTPQINGTAEVSDFIEIPTSFIPGEFFGGEPGEYIGVQFGQQWIANAGLTATQLIFDGSYLVGLKASRTYQDLSRKQTRATQTETVVNVSKAYYSALVADSRLALIEANIDRLKSLFNETRILNENGFVEKLDVDRVELSYNNLLVEKDKILRLKDLSYALLKFQMGMDPRQEITLTDKLQDFPLQDVAIPDSVDFNKRPEYGVIETQRRLQELDLKRYNSAYYPSLAAFGSLSANASRNEFDFFDTGKKWYPTAIVGLRLTVPIWDGLQRNSRVQQSKLKLKQVENSITQVKQGFSLDLLNTKSNYQNSLASLETTKRNRDLAIEIARVSRIKYQNGVGSSLDLVTAETSLRESEANYFNTLYDAIISKIDLDKSTGNITF